MFRVEFSPKNIYLVDAIIKAEELEVSRRVTTDALGDDIIEVFGSKEEISILREIYQMVS